MGGAPKCRGEAPQSHSQDLEEGRVVEIYLQTFMHKFYIFKNIAIKEEYEEKYTQQLKDKNKNKIQTKTFIEQKHDKLQIVCCIPLLTTYSRIHTLIA